MTLTKEAAANPNTLKRLEEIREQKSVWHRASVGLGIYVWFSSGTYVKMSEGEVWCRGYWRTRWNDEVVWDYVYAADEAAKEIAWTNRELIDPFLGLRKSREEMLAEQSARVAP